MNPRPFSLLLYRFASRLLGPFTWVLLEERARRGKEERTRLGERRGESTRARPSGRLAWLHGASVGETLSMLPLIEKLTQRGLTVLVTSGTVTSARLLEWRLPPGAIYQFVPLDVPAYARRFFDHWRPDIALIAKSELWPNLIMEADKRDIPLVQVNGRMSERSYRRWQRMPAMIGALLGRFDLSLAQSRPDADRLSRLGAPRVGVAGNLKFDVPPPPADPLRLSALAGLVGDRPVWIAASTHPGEEEQILAVHRTLMARFPNLLTIIAPRHPHRGEEIARLAEDARLHVGLRSRGLEPDGAIDIYVADTIGELGLFYRLAPVVFMGGSLVPHGGQNPIEPGKLGAAIVHGPHVHNFVDVYAALDKNEAAIAVADHEHLARTLSRLLVDGHRMRAMARAAADTVESLGGAVERTLQAIEPFLFHMQYGSR